MSITSAARAARHRTVTLGSLIAIVLALGTVGCSRSLDMNALNQSISSGVNDQLALPIAGEVQRMHGHECCSSAAP